MTPWACLAARATHHRSLRCVVDTTEAGTAAITRAGWHVHAGHQLWENYGQPNHIYFEYHGFRYVQRLVRRNITSTRSGPCLPRCSTSHRIALHTYSLDQNAHDCAQVWLNMTGNVQFAEAIEQAGLPASTPICVARPNGVAKVHPQYGVEEHALEYVATLARHTADPLPVVLHTLREAAQQFISTAATTLQEDETLLHSLQQNKFLMYVSCVAAWHPP